jgi:hypothetical protein
MILTSHLGVQQTNVRSGFVKHLSETKAIQLSLNKLIAIIVMNLVAPIAAALDGAR